VPLAAGMEQKIATNTLASVTTDVTDLTGKAALTFDAFVRKALD